MLVVLHMLPRAWFQRLKKSKPGSRKFANQFPCRSHDAQQLRINIQQKVRHLNVNASILEAEIEYRHLAKRMKRDFTAPSMNCAVVSTAQPCLQRVMGTDATSSSYPRCIVVWARTRRRSRRGLSCRYQTLEGQYVASSVWNFRLEAVAMLLKNCSSYRTLNERSSRADIVPAKTCFVLRMHWRSLAWLIPTFVAQFLNSRLVCANMVGEVVGELAIAIVRWWIAEEIGNKVEKITKRFSFWTHVGTSLIIGCHLFPLVLLNQCWWHNIRRQNNRRYWWTLKPVQTWWGR